jgi:hypothetical protein
MDPIARESFMLHASLSYVADLVGGEPLPRPQATLARD